MTATVHSEWIKLRTVRVHAVLVTVAVLFPLAITTLVAVFTPDVEDLGADSLAGLVAGTALISAILFGVVSAIALTGEFSHGTIRPTFAATPSHLRVYGAKLAVNSVTALLGGALLVLVCFGVGAAVVTQRGGDVSLSLDDGTVGALVGLLGVAVALSWFGLGIALLVRNSPAAVSIILLWPLFAENLLAGVLFLLDAEGLVRWLPYQAAVSAISVEPPDDQLGRPWGIVWFAVVSAAVIGVGLVLDRRRDA